MRKHRNSKQYIKVPITAHDLTLNELLIYSYINSYHVDGKPCYSSKTSIARYFNISRQTVIRVIKSLCDKGYITATYDSVADRSQYSITDTVLDKSEEYVSIDKSVLQSGLSGNTLLIYAYLKAHKTHSITKISEAVKVSISTVSRIVNRLKELGLVAINKVRTVLGRFAGTSILLHSAKCDSHQSKCDSHSAKCDLNTNNNTYYNNYKAYKQNMFNDYSMKSATYEGLTEQELEALLLLN